MLPLKFFRSWQVASIVILALVLLATILPAVWLFPDRGSFGKWFSAYDKWAHMFVFAFLALWFAGQFQKKAYWRVAIGLLAFGVLIEVCQRAVGYRTAEWLDVVADGVGIAAGLAVALLGLGGWAMHVENWLTRAEESS